MLTEKEVFYASLVDEISKTAKYLHNQLAQSKIKPQEAAPPNPSFQVKVAQYTAFDLGQFAGISGPGPGAYIRPDYLPPFFIPPLLRERGRRKRAFAESSYSGGLGPYGRLKYESGIPPFQAPSLKTAGPPAKEKRADEDRHRAAKLTAAGALGVAPMAGMIGQKPLIHDPLINPKGGGQRFRSMKDVSRAAMPGDVVVTSKPSGSMWKTMTAPITGSEFYHSQPVFGRRGGHGLTADTGYLEGDTLKEMQRRSGSLKKELATSGYKDVVLLRPKKPMTATQTRTFNREAMIRSGEAYDTPKAVNIWLKELLMPKIKGVTGKGPQVQCYGNVCSTGPAQAMRTATGQRVVPGKRVQDTFPTDFLRSENYEAVGHRLSGASRRHYAKMTPVMRKALPYASRGALGAGLAGTTYATAENPTAGAGVGAAAAASPVITALAKKHYGVERASEVLPSFKDLASAITTNTEGVALGDVSKKLLTRRLPIMAGVGGAAYLGARALRNRFAGDPTKQASSIAGGLTPAGRLQSARAVGMPKVTAPHGPSIAQISKPIGYGTPLPGATKTGAIAIR